MRVLMVTGPGIGHVFPLVPLAWALRSAGHEVLVVTTGPALAAGGAGLQVVDARPETDWAQRMGQLAGRRADFQKLMKRAQDGGMHGLRDAAPIMAVMSKMLVGPVVEIATDWRPHLVLQSAGQGSGYLAAAKLGVPLVEHGLGMMRAAGIAEALREQLAEDFDRHGLSALPESIATIDVAPPSMLAGEPEGWPMRYVSYNGGGVLPDWLLASRDDLPRPRIAVTLGTVSPAMDGIGPVERIIAVADQVDAEFVLAMGDDTDISGLGELPGNVRTAGWVPLSALLRSCHGLVQHGGEGTGFAALTAGVPQLVLPVSFRRLSAKPLADRGVALLAEPEDVDATLLRRLISDTDLLATAAEVRAEIESMPLPVELVPRLVELAGVPA